MALVEVWFSWHFSLCFHDVWKLCFIEHREHKWRIQALKVKYVFLIQSLFFHSECCFWSDLLHLNVWSAVKSPGFWSRPCIYTCFHYTCCTSSGGDKGRCDDAFSLDRAPGKGKRRGRDKLTIKILHRLTRRVDNLKNLDFKSLRVNWQTVVFSRWSEWCVALIGRFTLE